MTVPGGRLQFFALESTDYLERLALIASRPAAPNGDELVRLTRALRGAALMAGLADFARAAQAVEHFAKTYKDGAVGWTPDWVAILATAATELRRLVARAPDWDHPDTAAVNALIGTIGAPPARRDAGAAATDEIKPSVRAFVGREGALIAATLEETARALEAGDIGETADVVLKRLQSLRGLATLPSLSPLPEFLDGIELTIRTIREGAAPPNAPTALRDVAAAVSRLARDIADHGRASPDAPEVVAAARALVAAFGNDDDVVAIESLFQRGDSSPIVSRGTAPTADHRTDPQIELVSLADRFRQAADQLLAASGIAARTLSLYALAAQLGSIGKESAADRPALAKLLRSARAAIQNGSAEFQAADFAATLRHGAEQLAKAAEGRNMVVFPDQFDGLVTTFQSLLPSPAPTNQPAINPGQRDRDVVAIESLLAEEPSNAVLPSPFEHSFTTLHRLLEPIREPAERASIPTPAPDPMAGVVAIDTLLYRGRRALERADLVRRDLSDALKAGRSFPEVEPLVSELIDLVPLALAE